jgi:hypothetical protein
MARTLRYNDDDDDVLRDGKNFRVPLKLMDAFARELRAADDDAAAGHRPGYRIGDAASSGDERTTNIYDAYDNAIAKAWRDKPAEAKPSTAGGAQQVGDICTVRSGGGAFGPEGSPGHLQMIKGALTCVADPEFRQQSNAATGDAAPLNDQRTKAYDNYDQQLRDAWRSQ